MEQNYWNPEFKFWNIIYDFVFYNSDLQFSHIWKLAKIADSYLELMGGYLLYLKVKKTRQPQM